LHLLHASNDPPAHSALSLHSGLITEEKELAGCEPNKVEAEKAEGKIDG
jgi:hypothetical protein